MLAVGGGALETWGSGSLSRLVGGGSMEASIQYTLRSLVSRQKAALLAALGCRLRRALQRESKKFASVGERRDPCWVKRRPCY